MKLKIELFPDVYPPQTDTFLLLEHIRVKRNDVVLELCAGCGVVGLYLAIAAGEVIAVDKNPSAVANARYNAKINEIRNICVRQGDLYQPVSSKRFDLIVANPPYVPTPPDWYFVDILETAWNAGPDGRMLINSIIAGLLAHLKPGGRFVLVQSSLADISQTLNQLRAYGFSARIIAQKWIPFGPVCRGRIDWLSRQATFTSQAELLVVIEARIA